MNVFLHTMRQLVLKSNTSLSCSPSANKPFWRSCAPCISGLKKAQFQKCLLCFNRHFFTVTILEHARTISKRCPETVLVDYKVQNCRRCSTYILFIQIEMRIELELIIIWL